MSLPTSFESEYAPKGVCEFPAFTGTRIMMLPIVIGDPDSLNPELAHYRDCFEQVCSYSDHTGEVGYVTIDERVLREGESLRRPGKHVDGVYRGKGGSWGGGGGGWGSSTYGMLTASSRVGCKVWGGVFDGYPQSEGECDHLDLVEEDGILIPANEVWWLSGLCVHESLPLDAGPRQFLRLSHPSDAPWFEGYTESAHGIKPTGPILPRRDFMDL